MKKYVRILLIAIMSLLLVSCKKDIDKEVKDRAWFDKTVSEYVFINDNKQVTDNFELDSKYKEINISWQSDNSAILVKEESNLLKGIVTRKVEDTLVNLSASFSYQDFNSEKEYKVTVLKVEEVDENMRKVILNVEIPEELAPGEILTIGSNINGWSPANKDYSAVKISDKKYQLELDFDITEGLIKVEYKWTIQDTNLDNFDQWSRVEKSDDGQSEIDNRVIQVSGSSEIVVNVFDEVAFFADPNFVQPPTVVGNLEIIEDFEMPQLNRTRTIRVWTPENYDKNNKDKKYPVLYMHDAQNLFDTKTAYAGEWEVDETIQRMIDENGIDGFIVVGIDNSSHRMNEYTPDFSDKPEAEGGKYADFIVETLKPYIDEKYNTLDDRVNTLVAGSSMGGLISFYIGLKYSDVFGMIGAFSPSFQINTLEARNDFIKGLDLEIDNLPRLYIDAGTGESLQQFVPVVLNELISAGYDSDKIFTLIAEGDQHNESAWRRRFPEALEWLYSDSKGNYVEPTIEVNIEITISQKIIEYINTLGLNGDFYFYNGNIATSLKLDLVENIAKGRLLSKPNLKMNYQIIYFEEGVITLFETNGGAIVPPTIVDIDIEEINLEIDLLELEIKEKVSFNVNVPENTQTYFNSFNSENTQLLIYTGKLANSYVLNKINDDLYNTVFFLTPNSSISFKILFYSGTDKIQIYENKENGEGFTGSTYDIESKGLTDINHTVEGWQIPVTLTVNLKSVEIEVPENERLVMGLYQSIFGGSWRDSMMDETGENEYQISKETITGKIGLTAGYIIFKEGATSPYLQKFEKIGGTAVKVTDYEVYIPFSEWDKDEKAKFTINHIVSDEDINY